MVHTLFTIGYSDRSFNGFIALLGKHKITALCDVRSMPYSSRNSEFNREPLKKALKSHNIEYVFLGEELGARPKDPSVNIDLQESPDLEKRLIAQLKLHPDMFTDNEPSALIERAYDLRGDRIAYVEKGEPGQGEPVEMPTFSPK